MEQLIRATNRHGIMVCLAGSLHLRSSCNAGTMVCIMGVVPNHVKAPPLRKLHVNTCFSSDPVP